MWTTDNPEGGTVFHFTLVCALPNDMTVGDEGDDQLTRTGHVRAPFTSKADGYDAADFSNVPPFFR